MQLPEKIRVAIEILARYDVAPRKVVPRWYRLYLKFKPGTPPPLFGASKGAWEFLAVLLGVVLWFAVEAMGLYALLGSATATEAQWGTFVMAMVLVSLFSGVAGTLLAKAARMSYTHEAATLGLPAWDEFDATWRPSVQALRLRSQPERFWLRSLSSGIRLRAKRCDDTAPRVEKPYVAYAVRIGFLAFFLFAWFLPYQAGSYAEVLALLYIVVCAVGIYRTAKSRPLPPNPVAWQLTNGLLIGAGAGFITWVPIADVMHYPGGKTAYAFLLLCLTMHLAEAIWFEQQKTLAMRAERAEAERQLAEMRLSALKAQIEPHFIFNTIAHLRRLIAIDPARAERMADELSDFLRASLKSLRDEFTTVEEDIRLVEAYLQIAAIRMGTRLAVDVHVDPAVSKTRIPPMMLLTLVENAIQHGIEPKPEGGRITVSAAKIMQDANEIVRLSVADSGVGFGQNISAGSGLGLANIRERLRSVYGDRAELKLSNAEGSGVIAELHLPIEESK